MNPPPRIDLRAVTRILGGVRALDDVSFVWDAPPLLVLKGANGAGKSTLLRVLAGVVGVDLGAVYIRGEHLATKRAAALAHVGYLPDAFDAPPSLRVWELVELIASLRACPAPEQSLVDRLGVDAIWHEPFGGLSLGQRKRAAIVVALTGDPDILLLDEPTNGLDRAALPVLDALLRERIGAGKGVVLASHDAGFLGDVRAGVVELARGRVVGVSSRD